jgi:Ca2+-binding RTX toxin-like protein
MSNRVFGLALLVIAAGLSSAGCNNQASGVGALPQPRTGSRFAEITEASCPPGTNVIQGTEAADIIHGTLGSDCILGFGGDDVIYGGDGDDVIYGGGGNDTIHGENGSDTIYGGPGNDILSGGNGKDTIYGEDGDDIILGENGTDVLLSGGPGSDIIVGGNGNRGSTVIEGGDGADRCSPAAPGCEGAASLCGKKAECPSGQHCLAEAGVCLGCLSDQDCYDGNSCTSDACIDHVCQRAPIVQCSPGDGCCPVACNANSDSDCSPTCGNGVVENGETCDPAESCPASCNDGNACTVDQSTGSATNCSAACSHIPVIACTSADGCCPAGCDSTIDSDCSPLCGNGVVENGETCDPSITCPTTCDDGNACTIDEMTGGAANCNSACGHTTIVTCASGDGCCPAGCNANNDTDCSPMCGNEVVEPGETCDLPSTCPASCNDGNGCTIDQMTGSAANCNAACSHTAIVTCASGDGCCPAGCNANNDTDCSPMCGNEVVEPGETCDLPSTCPASCNDGNGCTIDQMTGSAANCNAACSHTAIVTCASGDGCCPAGCNANNDTDCSPMCGNEVVEPGETCDLPSTCPASCNDGNGCTIDQMTGSAANCNAACSHTAIVTCASGDGCCPAGCNANNDTDCSPMCGNEVVEPGETCDLPSTCLVSCNDGNGCTIDQMTGSAANCNAACSHTAIVTCASGDGCCPAGCNASNDTECSPMCGNEVVEPGETCDLPSTCPASCNDGNGCTIDQMTGSAANCNVVCSHTAIVSCASGDGCCPAGCNPTNDSDCPAFCGNEVLEPGETCDPPSSCPTVCDDGNACTIDQTTGSASTCSLACSHSAITQCAPGDGCCPAGCYPASGPDGPGVNQGLTGSYPFNGNANDESAYANNGTVYGALLAADRYGNPNSAYRFDGIDDYITAPDAPQQHAAAVTASVWIQPLALGSTQACKDARIVFKRNSRVSNFEGFQMTLAGATVAAVVASSAGQQVGVASSSPIVVGQWTHLVLTADGAMLSLYQNGSLVGSHSTGFPLDIGNRPLAFGSSNESCNGYFNGVIDDIRIYNRALAPAEIALLYGRNLDTDCSLTCGNLAVEPGETCDPPSSCPTTCDDHNACTIDQMTGSAATCNVACSRTAITSCVSGDGCCPQGCSAKSDTDCSPLVAITQLTSNDLDDRSPSVHGNQLVWDGDLNQEICERCDSCNHAGCWIRPVPHVFLRGALATVSPAGGPLCDYSNSGSWCWLDSRWGDARVELCPGGPWCPLCGQPGSSASCTSVDDSSLIDHHAAEIELLDGSIAVNLGRGTVPSVEDNKVAWLTGTTSPGGYAGWQRGNNVAYWDGVSQFPSIIGAQGDGAPAPQVTSGKVYYFSGAYMMPTYLSVWDGATSQYNIGGMYAMPAARRPMSVRDGRVAYLDGSNKVQLWDGTGIRQLSGYNGARGNPVFLNSDVVWASATSNDGYLGYNLIAWDGTALRSLVRCPDRIALDIAASGSLLAYSQWDGNDYEIFVWNGTTSHQITHNEYDDVYPSLEGNQLAWQGWDGNDWEIFLATLSTP